MDACMAFVTEVLKLRPETDSISVAKTAGIHLGMGQNRATRGPQVLVHVSIYLGSHLMGPILGYVFLTHHLQSDFK